MTDEDNSAPYRRTVKKNKLRMRYRHRLEGEISKTLEKLALLREIQAERANGI